MRINATGNVELTGTITSTSTTSRPIQNDEANDSPSKVIRNIRSMSQSAYTALGSKDANTLYIIVG